MTVVPNNNKAVLIFKKTTTEQAYDSTIGLQAMVPTFKKEPKYSSNCLNPAPKHKRFFHTGRRLAAGLLVYSTVLKVQVLKDTH